MNKLEKQDDRITFWLDEAESERAAAWIEQQWQKSQVTGCSGGRFTYMFTPTTLGMVTTIIDNVTKEELTLTDYNW